MSGTNGENLGLHFYDMLTFLEKWSELRTTCYWKRLRGKKMIFTISSTPKEFPIYIISRNNEYIGIYADDIGRNFCTMKDAFLRAAERTDLIINQ